MSLIRPLSHPRIGAAAALYGVRQAFHHWQHNEFDCAGCENAILALIDAIDDTLERVSRSQQEWDNARGGVDFRMQMLEGAALVGGVGTFHAFVTGHRVRLVACGVLP
ncbi:hypothetical protein R69658_06855 [Paraburkholderia aspalathi]|uniref:Uncharacterized protein n=1 Tax=Paraburkholderia aspalathi TaxID=1324617 RepID=A0ABN7N1E2_9BURK|nr:hypothetical protein [Paraburkholderia aspalathi]MBK3823206.1 hypothetical protein [Paraburkholderia aspalathi]MBK3835037.1 hypothetical protein [Paraburkholderia aspalathi]MBK3864791.1 hypothetical protein [Paraburkholderia aspalathi]CAE6844005.1 hypothetical protein R69658_06855 [Paraburkholderia aspalathi]